MNRMKATIAFALICVMCSTTYAAVPARITVQGRLTDLAGNPLPAGSKSLAFRIFDDSTAGTQIWPVSSWEFQSITSANDGLWIAMVGALIPLTDQVFAGTDRWLEVSVDMTIMPRVQLVTGPFAYRVATVDGASGGKISGKLTIGPGQTNTGSFAFVTGTDNQATGNYSAVGGGALNNATGESSVIAGGQQNDASAFASAIGGGASNDATNSHSVVSGGVGNAASGLQSSIGGGSYNAVTAFAARVSGGTSNSANADGATVGGGGNNHARGAYSTIAGGGGANPGDSNSALGTWSFVGGGTENIAGEWGATVSGGFVNLALDSVATIGGGVANGATGFASTIGGGSSNSTVGTYSTIAGGLYNKATDTGATVGGGANNNAHALFSTIAGGGGPLPEDSNSNTGPYGTIGGGSRNNVAGGHYATIGGGFGNYCVTGATVAGGWTNSASSGGAIAGGLDNFAYGEYSAVAGGRNNGATGHGAAIPGGEGNEAWGDWSMASGRFAYAKHMGSFVWADASSLPFLDSVKSTGPNQFIIRAQGGVGIGTNSPTEQLHVIGNILASGCVMASNLACPSDERLKEDIRTMDHALERVGKLRGVEYQWNDAAKQTRNLPEGQQVGLLAQEVREVVPQAVIERSDGFLAVDYARLVPLLIEGMKEQQKQIEMQQDQIEQLQRKLEQ